MLVTKYGLPDGAQVEVTDTAVVPMGDVRAYRQLTYTHGGDSDRPACRIVFEVRGAVPVCASFSLEGVDGQPVRAKDLRAIKLDELRDDVFGYVGVFVPNPDGGWVLRVGRGTYLRDRKHVEKATRRRKVTPEVLEKVAAVHQAAPEGGRIDAVRAAFGVQTRQAMRYIEQARGKGLL